MHIGDPEQGAELLAPMRAVAPPLIDLVDVPLIVAAVDAASRAVLDALRP